MNTKQYSSCASFYCGDWGQDWFCCRQCSLSRVGPKIAVVTGWPNYNVQLFPVGYLIRVSEIQKWCGFPWATSFSNFTCPPKILVAHHQQIFDEQQQQIIWSVCPMDNWSLAGTCPQLWGMCPGHQFQKHCSLVNLCPVAYICMSLGNHCTYTGYIISYH
jgi:hypothetical protein